MRFHHLLVLVGGSLLAGCVFPASSSTSALAENLFEQAQNLVYNDTDVVPSETVRLKVEPIHTHTRVTYRTGLTFHRVCVSYHSII